MGLEPGLPHPGDASRWVPVADLLAELYAKLQAAGAMLDQQAQTLIDHDVQFKVHGEALDAHRATLDGMATQLETLTGRIKALEDGHAEQAVWLSELEDRIDVLEPKPLPSGPAFGIDVSKYQTVEQIRTALAGQPDFCIVNATTGLRTISPSLATNTTEAREWADLTGFYHWAQTVNDTATTPDKSDPIGEAKHFNANSGAKVGDLICLDNEEALGTWQQRLAYDIAWLEYQRDPRGGLPLNYKNWDWIKNLRTVATVEQWVRWSAFPIWLADYSGVPGQHSTISPKTGTNIAPRILVHQYSTADNLDRNWTPDIAAVRACAVTK